MKKNIALLSSLCTLLCVLATGCKSKNGNVWDDNPVAESYRGLQSLWNNDATAQEDSLFNPTNEDFVSLKDEDLKPQFADGAIPQPKNSPGERGSGLPGIEGFHSPAGQEAAVFRNVYFNTDDHILRGRESLEALDNIAQFLKSHPQCFIFVEGHCDERGPEAYNLALGSRRSNFVRSYLVQQGVDMNRIHTISYGKERPANLAHNSEAWSKNRRAAFKIYNRK